MRARAWLRVSTSKQDEETQLSAVERRIQFGDRGQPWAFDGETDTYRAHAVHGDDQDHPLRRFPVRVEDSRNLVTGQPVFHGVEPQTHAVIEIQQPSYVETGWSAVLDVETSFDEVRRRFANFLIETR